MMTHLTRSFMRLQELEAWHSEIWSILSCLDDTSLAVVEQPFHLLLFNVEWCLFCFAGSYLMLLSTWALQPCQGTFSSEDPLVT